MSKLKTILDTLESRQDISVFHRFEKTPLANFLQDGLPVASYDCDEYLFWVAPKQGLYEVDGLQEFMMGLFPGLEPFSMEPFKQDSDYLYFGKLKFLETIARSSTRETVTILDEDLFVDGKSSVEEKDNLTHNRRVEVVVFPHEEVEKYIRKKNLGWYGGIYLGYLKRFKPGYKPGILDRLKLVFVK